MPFVDCKNQIAQSVEQNAFIKFPLSLSQLSRRIYNFYIDISLPPMLETLDKH